jgi:Family of unknown function (DUF6062)
VSPAAPRDATAFEAREALGAHGCAVCRLALRSVSKLLQSIAYEQVNDLALREQLRRGGGFCNPHAHQWLAEAHSVLGTALIYRDVLQAAIRALDKAEPNGQRSRLFGGLLGSTQQSTPCPACQAQLEAETRYLKALLAVLAADVGARHALEASDGLCRRHTLAAIRSGGEGATHVAQRARDIVDALIDDLDEVIRKEDYRFRHEPRTDAERSANSRAINWAAGAEGLVED